MTNPVLEANERAYAEYLAAHPHYIPSQREIFDLGWEAAIEYINGTLWNAPKRRPNA